MKGNSALLISEHATIFYKKHREIMHHHHHDFHQSLATRFPHTNPLSAPPEMLRSLPCPTLPWWSFPGISSPSHLRTPLILSCPAGTAGLFSLRCLTKRWVKVWGYRGWKWGQPPKAMRVLRVGPPCALCTLHRSAPGRTTRHGNAAGALLDKPRQRVGKSCFTPHGHPTQDQGPSKLPIQALR